ncbi:MAG: SRPBCC family protein [Frankiaceae bacterium]
MAEIVCAVQIDAPPEDVWAAVIDWRGQGEWMLATRVRPTSRGGQGVGARIEAVTGVGRLAVHDPMEITHWEPPRRCLVRHLGRVIRGAGAFEVEPIEGGRSRLLWSEWLDLPLGRLGQVGFLAVRPLLRAGVQLSLRRLAGRLGSARAGGR